MICGRGFSTNDLAAINDFVPTESLPTLNGPDGKISKNTLWTARTEGHHDTVGPAIAERCRRNKRRGAIKMRAVWVTAAAILALSPISLALAETQLPTTIVTASKPKPARAAVVTRTAPSRSTSSAAILPDHPDPSTPHVRARDWNAPGVMNLEYMTDVQFAAFQAAHPTAVFVGRCYTGQDPDPNIRASFRRTPSWKFCKG
jgi:hypothetical protein